MILPNTHGDLSTPTPKGYAELPHIQVASDWENSVIYQPEDLTKFRHFFGLLKIKVGPQEMFPHSLLQKMIVINLSFKYQDLIASQ